jgi:hypothetical protein
MEGSRLRCPFVQLAFEQEPVDSHLVLAPLVA